MRVAAITLLAIAVLALAAVGRAQDVETIVLPYDAPTECPDAKVFAGQLEARTAHARVATEAGATGRVFDVRILKLAAGYKGTLSIHAEGAASIRTVTARACKDVVEALALVSAIAIDPDEHRPFGDVHRSRHRI